MAEAQFSLVPESVPLVDTTYRRICTKFPVPESVPILEQLQRNEPLSMSSQAPVLWDRAEKFQVYDRYGNMWLDWSSGVLVANSGHAHPRVREAITAAVGAPSLHNYAFPSRVRAELTSALLELAPGSLDKAYLLTTGSEATECAIKLSRLHGRTISAEKIGIVSFDNAFHGRTLGAQMAGGIPSLKGWIGELAPGFYQVPFPDGYRNKDIGFDDFLVRLKEQGVAPERIAAVMTETYQGGDASFASTEFMQSLRGWCTEHQILLVCDEVQAGFGRTGKQFAFEHYGIVPDLICCGKGISSSLPVAAVIGPSAVMNLPNPGEMTSTHAGNPVCCAAALANLEVIKEEGLVSNAERVGAILHDELRAMEKNYSVVGKVHGKGLVAGILIVRPGTEEPDAQLAHEITLNAIQSGLLLFAPVGLGGGTVKIAPPLCMTADAVREGATVLDAAIEKALETRLTPRA